MKRTIVIILVLILLLGSIVYAESDVSSEFYSDKFDEEKFIEQEYTLSSNLNANTREELKGLILDEMIKRNTVFSINFTGETDSSENFFTDVIKEIYQSNPYIEFTSSGYAWKCSSLNGVYDITYNANYLHNQAQEQALDEEVNNIINEIIDDNMTDLEKIKKVYDYIILNGYYGTDTEVSSHSPYALLFEKQGVCQAYASLTYKFLDKLNFNQYYVIGTGNGEAHAWNLVEIDNEWFMLDVTWGDNTKEKNPRVEYKYFLNTSDFFRMIIVGMKMNIH